MKPLEIRDTLDAIRNERRALLTIAKGLGELSLDPERDTLLAAVNQSAKMLERAREYVLLVTAWRAQTGRQAK